MPAQAIIRNLTRTRVETEIAKLKAKALLEVAQDEGLLLVRCRTMDGAVALPKAPKMLQAICDLDAKITRASNADDGAGPPRPRRRKRPSG